MLLFCSLNGVRLPPSFPSRYDMAFDARFSYFGLVERLARAAGLHEPPEGQKPQLVRAVAVGS